MGRDGYVIRIRHWLVRDRHTNGGRRFTGNLFRLNVKDAGNLRSVQAQEAAAKILEVARHREIDRGVADPAKVVNGSCRSGIREDVPMATAEFFAFVIANERCHDLTALQPGIQLLNPETDIANQARTGAGSARRNWRDRGVFHDLIHNGVS